MAVETVRELIHEVEKAEADAEKIHEEMNEVPEDVRELVRSDLNRLDFSMDIPCSLTRTSAMSTIREMLSVSV